MNLSLVASALGVVVLIVTVPYGAPIMIGTGLVALGLAFSYTYQGANKGLQEFGKAALYPGISNVIQLVVVVACVLWLPQQLVLIALASYGFSYFIALLPLEALRRASVPFDLLHWQAKHTRDAIRVHGSAAAVSCVVHRAVWD